MPDPTFEKLAAGRAKLPALCDEILKFLSMEVRTAPNYIQRSFTTDEKLLKAVADGFFTRLISNFRAILILENSGLRSEWLMLARTMFEISVDAAYFYNEIAKSGTPVRTLKKIRYATVYDEADLLKESEALDPDQLEQLKEKVAEEKVPGLTRAEHKSIAHNRNFSGLHVRARCTETDAAKYYKPLYGRLSKYAHGMTFEEAIMIADGTSREKLNKAHVSEEGVGLFVCAFLILNALAFLGPLTGRIYDPAKVELLDKKLESLYNIENS